MQVIAAADFAEKFDVIRAKSNVLIKWAPRKRETRPLFIDPGKTVFYLVLFKDPDAANLVELVDRDEF